MSVKFCEHCKAGDVLPGEPKGEIKDGAYFIAGSDSTANTKAIVLLTDVFGLPLVNSKIIADQLAENVGCDVWVPDQFNGNPPFGLNDLDGAIPQRPGEKIPFLAKLSLIWTIIKGLPSLISSRPSVVDGRIHTFIKKIKDEKKYTRIGAVGYCFGGSTLVRLASKDLINSAVVVHPGRITTTEIAAMKIPTSWQCAEEDMAFGPKLRNEAEAIFAARKDKPEFIDYEFHDYKGTVHGFGARPNFAIPEAKEGFEKQFEATVQWFKKTL
ncbi:dienelactone hydrolase endo-1,3,1,4-beta-D-glucanase [Fomitiporia mediterranea MF3/22]|uniref:dienelactone hydrolase endo-1,3,1,4-beta-D-glucanase n=1 Tax=Fomitiporia mediterranea (strain MF3/22) TaxID=694068 RepID=UPI0004409B23|nr:dienelactone hydrolase endo-1,3,1,4-beta-D-glucanase [Fomitiporia mediterranea MF3/22]EJC97916.1 dienelactone hydrolase endo-1,3,1,4-beta-D-glucanase [Fomitiporia mediterranea MF3/22]